MNLLGMSQDELETSGAYWTAREISQQPAVWIDIERVVSRDADALRAYLEPLLMQQELRIVLTGAGTSACIGECLAPALTRRLGRRVEAVATTDLVASPESWLAPTAPVLLVSFARSGNSPESVAALTLIAACVVALTAGDSDGSAHPNDIVVPGATAAPNFDLCFPYAVFAQTLALLQSLTLGLRPDSPNAKGVVHRVVQGVSIYPRNPRR